MNATQDASNDAQNKINRQLVDYNQTQNDLIFKTRKRLFELENNQKMSFVFIGLLFMAILLLAVKGVING
jgi:hypothetical protein|tara:strand:+ start:102 stop:311 length:210 start_codon:yes stop_codon:yes gene_type:complete